MNTRTSRYKLFEYVIVQTDPETERSTRIQFCLTYVPQAIACISFFVKFDLMCSHKCQTDVEINVYHRFICSFVSFRSLRVYPRGAGVYHISVI